MEVSAKCRYDYASVKALTHLAMFKKANPKSQLTLWTAVFAFFSLVIILEILAFGANKTLFVLLGAEIFGIVLLHFLYFAVPKIQHKAMAKMQNIENQYVFYDNVLKIFTKGQEYNGEAEINYSLFVRAYETNDYLFLYQTNNQVFIVNKRTVEGGTAGDIRSRLTSYLKDKYIICKY